MINRIKTAPNLAFLPKGRLALISHAKTVASPVVDEMLAAYDATKKKAEEHLKIRLASAILSLKPADRLERWNQRPQRERATIAADRYSAVAALPPKMAAGPSTEMRKENMGPKSCTSRICQLRHLGPRPNIGAARSSQGLGASMVTPYLAVMATSLPGLADPTRGDTALPSADIPQPGCYAG